MGPLDKLLSRRASTLGGASLDKQDVAVFDHIILSLGHHLTLCLDLGLVPKLLKNSEIVHDGLDERLLEVSVDDPGRLGSFGPVADRPLPHLVLTNSEEASQVEDF